MSSISMLLQCCSPWIIDSSRECERCNDVLSVKARSTSLHILCVAHIFHLERWTHEKKSFERIFYSTLEVHIEIEFQLQIIEILRLEVWRWSSSQTSALKVKHTKAIARTLRAHEGGWRSRKFRQNLDLSDLSGFLSVSTMALKVSQRRTTVW